MIYQGNSVLGDFFTSRREKGKAGLPTLAVTVNEGIICRDELERKTDTNLSPEKHLLIKKEDLAYNMMRMWQGASGRSKVEGIVSPAYVVLAPKSSVDSEYAAYLFKTPRMVYLFWAYSYGLTKDRLRLYYNDFKRIPVEFPNKEKQIKLAQILSTWDRAITKVEALIINAEQQKTALMQQLLTGKKRLDNSSAEWKFFSLGELFKERIETNRIDLPLLAITSSEGVIYREETGRKDTSNSDKSKYRRISPRDIGYNTMRMWQGISAMSNIEGIISPAYTVAIPSSNIDPLFISYLFKHPKVVHLFYRYSQGLVSDTWNLKFSNFKKVKICVPDLKEQKSIAAIIWNANQEIVTLRGNRKKLIEEKKALMQQLLSSKQVATFSDNKAKT